MVEDESSARASLLDRVRFERVRVTSVTGYTPEAFTMNQIRRRILCVDENADVREMLTALLGAAGYDATAVSAAGVAARSFARDGFDLFILDGASRTDAGWELCRGLRVLHPDTPIIIYSADAFERHHREAAEAGATACVDKPNIRPLVRAVEELVGRSIRL